VRILYRDREAWVDLCEEPEGTEPEPSEIDALRAFTLALPAPPRRIPIGSSYGVAEYLLLDSGVWPHEEGTRFATYTMRIEGGESPLPYHPPSEEQKAPGRAALKRIRRDVDAALRGWESNDYAAAVQCLKTIERDAHDLIGPASGLIGNYVR
jgi:hypothetical protein